MNESNNNFIQRFTDGFKAAPDDRKAFLKFHPNYEARNTLLVFMLGVLFTPVTLAGSLIGYARGYNRFYRDKQMPPNFYPMTPILRLAMLIGALFLWAVVIVLVAISIPTLTRGSYTFGVVLIYLVCNFAVSCFVFTFFNVWRWGINTELVEGEKFGTARFARADELEPYKQPKGLYIGGRYHYAKQGHILTMAGSRAGKFTNLIAPNLLGWGNIDGSFVVIDPKGEIAAVTSKYQQSIGQDIVILNPWELLPGYIGAAQSYNPMDILDTTSIHFVDDCTILAEMLVPLETSKNKFFSDSARAIIGGLLMYIAISQEGDERTLKTLWKWLRLPQREWDRVIAEMQNYDIDSIHAENLSFAAGEIEKIASSGGNTWGSVLATALQATEFLKSPSLQKSLQSGFDPKTLAHKKATVYVIIPADKLQSHSRWLRLVVTSMMRAVIRHHNNRVCFILDEFAALGYLPEIETALGTYAGFNVTVWAILQSLVQLQHLYEKNWEVFVGNSAVRQYFGIHNNFDAQYISTAIGRKSHVIKNFLGRDKVGATANQRDLITPDELRIAAGGNIFAFIDDKPPTWFAKRPYYEVKDLDDRAEKNPYT